MNVILAAGGTGGHMIPAHALADELKRRGHGVMLVTDQRGAGIPAIFDDVETHVLPAGRLQGGPLGMIRTIWNVYKGTRAASELYESYPPDVVVGFGGYPALPSLLAAQRRGIPTLLHEQNAVLGRVNRALAGKAKAVATAYRKVQRLKDQGKAVLVGNPVRAEIQRLGEIPFPAFDESSPLHILVTGGSQGARVLGEVVPAAMGRLPEELKHRLNIVQQCRPEDIDDVRQAYVDLDIPAETMTYIEDMPGRIGDAHLVIARAGASTIAELTVAGRPAILVPLPSATDNHQTYNAMDMAEGGGARMIRQENFTAETLAAQVAEICSDPQALANAAQRSLAIGKPHAASELADLVERVAAGDNPMPTDPVRAQRPAPRTGGMGVPA
ncbi:undecaprenyldiphospho-muramoylpentapeptide beta-N-acetylglucosaminyltransferase [Sphingomicrobium lutaoense]|uniref:UDP-N-acetylglucosamine--N-acetylmuramyl-(pentapeptide) pyrophosphoryl-undecaprenol N-acetylglucosamine transferase n=1 Tax=Sphingomicrobium lutaoense TaxID=515949 RepID=A0A839YZD8_9SPHN|nr:undecaprenyldiphospho-muramoylpentapeptide beta-N-acetylglucosaminyltransferase [Sphingomicrobium lutaoense]MBB3764356.1 UDP-N-acetylglucosamine--N-acetylmuramyl-(pentapeptide) pyrophosphoryl-undecaprenol N-acetylglucosamine transferase [Sphingomicrobium lutaoense]